MIETPRAQKPKYRLRKMMPNQDRAIVAQIVGIIAAAALLYFLVLAYKIQSPLVQGNRGYSRSSYSEYYQYRSYASLAEDYEEAKQNINHMWLVIKVLVVTYIGYLVLLLLWFGRAYHNLNNCGLSGLARHGPEMAILGWFIPFANIVLPPRIAYDIGLNMQRLSLWHQGKLKEEGESPQPVNIVGLWWGSMMFQSVIFLFVWYGSSGGRNLESQLFYSQGMFYSLCVGLFALLAWVWMIRVLSQHELRAMELHNAAVEEQRAAMKTPVAAPQA